MRILITGSAGFIGSHLVDTLLLLGHDVWGVDDLSGGKLENIHPDMIRKTYFVDLRDPIVTKAVVDFVKPEVVYHLAANAAENKAQFSPIDISTRNYETFLNVVVSAINNKVKRFIVTSSIAVYGHPSIFQTDEEGPGSDPVHIPFKESQIPSPEDVYGISKLAMEQTLEVLAKVHGFEHVILRPHNVYGPRQNMTDPYRNVVTIFMNSILKGEDYYVYGDGNQRRCFSYVSDVVAAMVVAATADVSGGTFNLGADKHYTINELAQTIREVAGSDSKAVHLPDRAQEVRIAIADHTQAKERLGYQDRTSLEDGIKRTWDWAVKKGAQEPVYGNFEILSPKIPKNWLKDEPTTIPDESKDN